MLGVIAQLVARLNGIHEVTSSNLVSSTKKKAPERVLFFGKTDEPLELAGYHVFARRV